MSDTTAPNHDVMEIDLHAVMIEQIEEAAIQSPWVPPEYMMNEIVSDCCAFLREPREPYPGATAAKALEQMIAEEENARLGDLNDWEAGYMMGLRAALRAITRNE